MRNGGRRLKLEKKIRPLNQLKRITASLKKSGKKIVFTNGCFDLLHYGHVKYLEGAKNKGDALIVAVNSDGSVKKLKGKNRPLVSGKYRQRVLAALECVDFVVLFNEETPLKTIIALKPDVLVKGGDWKQKDIVGSDFVKSCGGKVFSIGFVKGFSSSALIRKIKKGH
jgi:D-beta-D-heptose 7-phosphate kinase/D-beta-D-heptose 1-phosphate adenosyltransferase